MGILSDRQIRAEGIISNRFAEMTDREGILSYGCGSYGYTARVGFNFQVFTAYPPGVIDPKNFDQRMLQYVDVSRDFGYIDIPPHSFVLAETVEEFAIPRDVLCVVVGKSTYARCGLIVNVTPLEPEWRGIVTVELSNTTHLPIRVYAGEGIMQCLFFRSDEVSRVTVEAVTDSLRGRDTAAYGQFVADTARASCQTSYADRKGKYQDQTGIRHPTANKS